MTIASSLPISTNPTVINSTIGIAVLSKNFDVFEVAGRDLIKMMEQSVNPNLGTNIDIIA